MPSNTPVCDAGLHCDPASQTCARYRCTDADCGTGTNKCVLDQTVVFGGPLPYSKAIVGICLKADMTGQACDAPATVASMGSCGPAVP
jgi:hypothetical protein